MYSFIIILIVLIILLIVCAGVYLLMTAPGRVDKKNYAWLAEADFAHRGLYTADQKIPENSLEAFSKAALEGYGIELDVELTKDDALVVFHDDSLERMTGRSKLLWNSGLHELENLSLAGSSQRIPLFADVLKLVGGRVPLIVEIKTTTKLKKICSMTYELLKGYEGDYCIESFNPFIIGWFRRHAPKVLRGQLSMRYTSDDHIPGYQKFLMENLMMNFVARPQFIAYHYEDADKLSFRLCRRLGAITVAWTVRSPKAMELAKKAFDAVIFEHFLPHDCLNAQSQAEQR
jgi:glycerophosphoryl diester phosphodiesterase